MNLTKSAENPILRPDPDHSRGNLVVCSPGIIREDGNFRMLHRASGDQTAGVATADFDQLADL